MKVKLYSGLKILTSKNTCKSCKSVSVSSVSGSYTTISHRNANLSAIADFGPPGHSVDHEAAFQEYHDRMRPFVEEVQIKFLQKRLSIRRTNRSVIAVDMFMAADGIPVQTLKDIVLMRRRAEAADITEVGSTPAPTDPKASHQRNPGKF